jgi:toxin ParE1/3/4
MYVFDEIEKVCSGLNILPHRGARIKHPLTSTETEFREVFFKPYRVIYRIDDINKSVFIIIISDGRRNMQRLLRRRLLTV